MRWLPARHLTLLDTYLVRVAVGKLKRLMVFMPPRHGKSEFISRFFTAWYLGMFPERKVILTSYEMEFASSWGRRSRDLLEDVGDRLFPTPIRIRQDSSSASRWEIRGHMGGMVTSGVGGPITGRGADLLIIDDPVKNAEEANSKTYREKAWEWYRSTAYTRLEPGGAIILIMTRWHEDDLAGRLLKEMKAGGDQWEILKLPALAEENDPLGRAEGEPLWPERFDRATLLETKRTAGPYWWSALYQQSPHADIGNLFKRTSFRYWRREGEYALLPDGRKVKLTICKCYQTCDPAGSAKTSADWFVLGTWFETPDHDLLLADIIRVHLEGPDQPALMWQAFRQWKPLKMGVEVGPLGMTLFQQLRREGLPVVELKPDRDKVTRAIPMAARYETGSVYHLGGAPWIGDYEEELVAFPNAEHDDQVDVAAYAYQMQQENLMNDPERLKVMAVRKAQW